MLSPRQREIVRRLVNGQIEKEIAVDLRITRHTVHVHMKAIFDRTGVQSRGELLGRIIHYVLKRLPKNVGTPKLKFRPLMRSV